MSNRLDKTLLKESFTFEEYIQLLGRLVEESGTSGPEQSEQRVIFTKLNLQRTRRILKTLALSDEIKKRMAGVGSEMLWIVIVESWCGDVPHNLPYIHAISELSDRVTLKVILRDENPEIMDRFLTDGTRSIPKMICLDPESCEVAGTWGPRPAGARLLVSAMTGSPAITREMRNEAVQRWYNENKGQELQSELFQIIRQWDLHLEHAKPEEVG